MTDLEKFNLLWLCYAMTAPSNAEETYYYDGKTKKFFYTKRSNVEGNELYIYDMLHLSITGEEAMKLSKKVEGIDSEQSEVVEIPRLNVQDKVAVQLLFLSKLSSTSYAEQLSLSVKQQSDTYGFKLDALLTDNPALHPVEPYWEDFKLKTIQYYLEKYTGVVGIGLRLIK